MADVWANSKACHPSATCHIAGWCHLANSMSWFQSYVSHCSVLPPGEFNGMSSQSPVSYCRVLPLGEFTVTIPQPRATLHGAVIRRNQCHDRATSQGVKIPSAILKIVFRHILFFALMQLRFRRAAAFVSSPIHLFYITFLHFFTFNGTYCESAMTCWWLNTVSSYWLLCVRHLASSLFSSKTVLLSRQSAFWNGIHPLSFHQTCGCQQSGSESGWLQFFFWGGINAAATLYIPDESSWRWWTEEVHAVSGV